MGRNKKDMNPMSFSEAVDALSEIVDLDLATKLTKEKTSEKHSLIDPKYRKENQDKVLSCLNALKRHLEDVYEDDELMRDPAVLSSIQAMIRLVTEAGDKIDKFTPLFKSVDGIDGEKQGIKERPEFKGLHKYYIDKYLKAIKEELEEEAADEDLVAPSVDVEQVYDIEKKTLYDLETIKSDTKYELLYIDQEDSTPFFHQNLLRHLKLIGRLDQSALNLDGFDPLVEIGRLVDRDYYASAQFIRAEVAKYIDHFLSETKMERDEVLFKLTNRTVMSLLLAANAGNLVTNFKLKNCERYFVDFQIHLREALSHEEYANAIDSMDTLESWQVSAINLLHALCYYFFMRIGDSAEISVFIREIIARETTKKEPKGLTETTIWKQLIEWDRKIRAVIGRYPSGPFLKAMDFFLENQQEDKAFDPLAQKNLPRHLYTYEHGRRKIDFIRLPAPVHQSTIDDAQVVSEFTGWIRYLASAEENQHVLIVNLQDRVNWDEEERAHKLEKEQFRSEYSNHLTVITIPKSSDFYYQIEAFENQGDPNKFRDAFYEQYLDDENGGFYLPPKRKSEDFNRFVKGLIGMIGQFFFADREVYSRQDRLDFIEIFYQFFILKVMEDVRADCVSFTCKDAVDKGSAENCTFFAFLKELGGSTEWTENEKDFMLFMLYGPAFLVRDRVIQLPPFNRMVSALAHLSAEISGRRKELIAAMKPYFHAIDISTISVRRSA